GPLQLQLLRGGFCAYLLQDTGVFSGSSTHTHTHTHTHTETTHTQRRHSCYHLMLVQVTLNYRPGQQLFHSPGQSRTGLGRCPALIWDWEGHSVCVLSCLGH